MKTILRFFVLVVFASSVASECWWTDCQSTDHQDPCPAGTYATNKKPCGRMLVNVQCCRSDEDVGVGFSTGDYNNYGGSTRSYSNGGGSKRRYNNNNEGSSRRYNNGDSTRGYNDEGSSRRYNNGGSTRGYNDEGSTQRYNNNNRGSTRSYNNGDSTGNDYESSQGYDYYGY